ncbi:helix-turn-helix domain-containing protein [Yinghuangia soli]|uniref:Helix-turn-helix domain-containing protein n=1 Tax=Yinghuangia soli TaxID=2908204 RepID=A0AA41Q848_9ACTN|nr:helix-turn-helix transcriptional regulator [Yinghuangia soli]MCF2532134.1 helix-turn-helix domain-containing protein [Yinghuangia soli]
MALAPTYARRELGAELKRLREAARLTQAVVAKAHKWSTAKMIRLEGGLVTLTLHDLHLLADFYGADEDERLTLIELMERAEEGQWWHAYGRIVPLVLDEFLALEAQAASISNMQMTTVPGLLQCRSYAEAMFRNAAKVPDPDDAAALVDLRMKRQRVLSEGTAFDATISEVLLLQPMGGREVLKDQLAHLARMAELPNVTIRVVPLSTEQPLTIGGLILFDFADQATPVSYTEDFGGITPHHNQIDVRRHRREADRVRSMAWSPEESLTNIQARLREL